MIEITKGDATLILGTAVSERQGTPFADQLRDGDFAIVDGKIKVVTLSDSIANPDMLKDLTEDRTVFTCSLGMFAVEKARQIIAINPVEPTTLSRLAVGAWNVAQNSRNGHRGPGSNGSLVLESTIELVQNLPTNLRALPRLNRFSTLAKILELGEEVSEASMMFFTNDDEYGFGNNGTIGMARAYGIHAEMLKGTHNHFIHQPRDMVRQIAESINIANTTS